MSRPFRLFLIALSVTQLIAGLGFVFDWKPITDLWPLDYTNRTTLTFIGSIFLAGAASQLWCVWANEGGALAGVALDYLGIFTPVSIFAYQISGGRGALAAFSAYAAAGALFGLGLFVWSVRIPIRDTRPMPALVRVAFVVFVIALLLAGGAMVLKQPNILPWEVPTTGQVIYGWMFLGAAAYFSYALLRPGWGNTGGQLAGFLAYDVVLIVPFLLMLPDVRADRLPNLLIYLVVVIGSAVLAAYSLFVHRTTRARREQEQDVALVNRGI